MAIENVRSEIQVSGILPLDSGNLVGPEFFVDARDMKWGGPLPLEGTIVVFGTFDGATLTIEQRIGGQWFASNVAITAALLANGETVSMSAFGCSAISATRLSTISPWASKYRAVVSGGGGSESLTVSVVSPYKLIVNETASLAPAQVGIGNVNFDLQVSGALVLDNVNTSGPEFAPEARDGQWGGPLPLIGTLAVFGTYGTAEVVIEARIGGAWRTSSVNGILVGSGDIAIQMTPNADVLAVGNMLPSAWANKYRVTVLTPDGATSLRVVYVGRYAKLIGIPE